MSKMIKVQVDYGNSTVSLNHEARYEERKLIFNELLETVVIIFDEILDSGFTEELPVMINIWDTYFLINDDNHHIENKTLLNNKLELLYKKLSSRIYGFRLVWEIYEAEERQDKMLKKIESMKGSSFKLSELFDED